MAETECVMLCLCSVYTPGAGGAHVMDQENETRVSPTAGE